MLEVQVLFLAQVFLSGVKMTVEVILILVFSFIVAPYLGLFLFLLYLIFM